MKYEHKTLDLTKSKDIKAGEKLLSKGWKIISYGMYLATFERKLKN